MSSIAACPAAREPVVRRTENRPDVGAGTDDGAPCDPRIPEDHRLDPFGMDVASRGRHDDLVQATGNDQVAGGVEMSGIAGPVDARAGIAAEIALHDGRPADDDLATLDRHPYPGQGRPDRSRPHDAPVDSPPRPSSIRKGRSPRAPAGPGAMPAPPAQAPRAHRRPRRSAGSPAPVCPSPPATAPSRSASRARGSSRWVLRPPPSRAASEDPRRARSRRRQEAARPSRQPARGAAPRAGPTACGPLCPPPRPRPCPECWPSPASRRAPRLSAGRSCPRCR